ncbi:hypothetical protein CI238_06091, partial [Colletotrichum incanum]
LNRWVMEYPLHLARPFICKTDSSVNEEMVLHFVLDVVEDLEADPVAVKKLPDLAGANPDDIKLLVWASEKWRRNTFGDVDMASNTHYKPRFSDLLVIDEGSLRPLAALPEQTPHVGPARNELYGNTYVWLVDSRAVNRFKGVEAPVNYGGRMKLSVRNIYGVWFERVCEIRRLGLDI